MNPDKRKRLESKGWRVGNAEEFLKETSGEAFSTCDNCIEHIVKLEKLKAELTRKDMIFNQIGELMVKYKSIHEES